jgi:hypothetical protein
VIYARARDLESSLENRPDAPAQSRIEWMELSLFGPDTGG